MKRRRKSIDFGKQANREGHVFSTDPAPSLPEWMQNPELLPKRPPSHNRSIDDLVNLELERRKRRSRHA